jgi:lysozyme family protein
VTSKTVDELLEDVLGKEGGYSNHPSDRGGETMWGITIRVARDNGYFGPMRELPRSRAKLIYYNEYYMKPRFDDVAALYPKVAAELFDTGVNAGVTRAGMFLQRALNGLNRQAKDYPDIEVDGRVGPGTLAALKAFKQRRGDEGEDVLAVLLNCIQGEYYLSIAEGRPKNEDFLYGWIKNRVMS